MSKGSPGGHGCLNKPVYTHVHVYMLYSHLSTRGSEIFKSALANFETQFHVFLNVTNFIIGLIVWVALCATSNNTDIQ